MGVLEGVGVAERGSYRADGLATGVLAELLQREVVGRGAVVVDDFELIDGIAHRPLVGARIAEATCADMDADLVRGVLDLPSVHRLACAQDREGDDAGVGRAVHADGVVSHTQVQKPIAQGTSDGVGMDLAVAERVEPPEAPRHRGHHLEVDRPVFEPRGPSGLERVKVGHDRDQQDRSAGEPALVHACEHVLANEQSSDSRGEAEHLVEAHGHELRLHATEVQSVVR